MKTYKCEKPDVMHIATAAPRLRVMMLEDHSELGGAAGEWTITSPLKMIDFERKYAVTQNSIYDWS